MGGGDLPLEVTARAAGEGPRRALGGAALQGSEEPGCGSRLCRSARGLVPLPLVGSEARRFPAPAWQVSHAKAESSAERLRQALWAQPAPGSGGESGCSLDFFSRAVVL